MSVHVFEAMGTVVSVRIPDDVSTDVRLAALAHVESTFLELDERFSLYRPDSEASRIARGDLSLIEASTDMREAYAESLTWRDLTHGAFTPHRPDGTLDLSGTIKARALERSREILREKGLSVFSVNAGGDLVTAGIPEEGAWLTGIANPLSPGNLSAIVSLNPRTPALATSGSAERGEHIWRRPDADGSFVQASVAAADIMTADVLATAIIAGGHETLDLVTARGDVGVLAIRQDGTMLGNDIFRGLITPAELPSR